MAKRVKYRVEKRASVLKNIRTIFLILFWKSFDQETSNTLYSIQNSFQTKSTFFMHIGLICTTIDDFF